MEAAAGGMTILASSLGAAATWVTTESWDRQCGEGTCGVQRRATTREAVGGNMQLNWDCSSYC